MTDLFAARSLMAFSLGFHILFALTGMAMPLLMVLAERRWLSGGDPADLVLARRWAKGTGILFAVGAVSGTALSFELGLLWPEFMKQAGPIIGMPFSFEGFAFFFEGIFLGIYLYGWDRIPPRWHLASGIAVAIFGSLSGFLVTGANAWMNTPQGFDVLAGGVTTSIRSMSDWPTGASLLGAKVVEVRPFEAMFSPAFAEQAIHALLSAFASVGFGVAGIHAWMLRRDPGNAFHQNAIRHAIIVGGVAAVALPISGDFSAKHVASHQPAKFAAMEAHWETGPNAALVLGGLPDEASNTNAWAIEIPRLLSFMAHGDFSATVTGLNDIPADHRPPVAVTHIAFQIMVASGFAMMAVGLLGIWFLVRGIAPWAHRWYLTALMWASPLGFLAVEAGWTVTEVGRQPWIANGMLRTAEAVTPMPGLTGPLALYVVLYAVLGVVVVTLLRYHVMESPSAAELANATRAGAAPNAIAGLIEGRHVVA